MLIDSEVLAGLQETVGVFPLWNTGVSPEWTGVDGAIVWVIRLRCSKRVLIFSCSTAIRVLLFRVQAARVRIAPEWRSI